MILNCLASRAKSGASGRYFLGTDGKRQVQLAPLTEKATRRGAWTGEIQVPSVEIRLFIGGGAEVWT